jgi:hypothetical protein|uniref:Uncharacterized protein n=1 Tax=Desulfobacca acetoxidans TaxID=60893 RepID=A0A7C5ALL1_9BACT
MSSGRRFLILAGAAALLLFLWPGAWVSGAAVRKCPPFHLKTEDGKIINPLTGENADQPYSPRQTCGTCHNYEEITKGFHFQQGWDKIRDNFSLDKPWVLSDGMMGKM